jgi:hypothetical protein
MNNEEKKRLRTIGHTKCFITNNKAEPYDRFKNLFASQL